MFLLAEVQDKKAKMHLKPTTPAVAALTRRVASICGENFRGLVGRETEYARSLRVRRARLPEFQDETSIGLAHALHSRRVAHRFREPIECYPPYRRGESPHTAQLRLPRAR